MYIIINPTGCRVLLLYAIPFVGRVILFVVRCAREEERTRKEGRHGDGNGMEFV